MIKKSASDVLQRLKIALGVESDTDLCNEINRICNEDVKRSALGNWRSRDTVPYTVCVSLAEKKGFSLNWLLIGEGEMLNKPSEKPLDVFDFNRFILAIETVEEGLQKTKRRIVPNKKAQLIMAVYDLFEEPTQPIKQSVVLKLVQSAA